MKTSVSKFVLSVLVILGILAVIFFIWPGPQLREAASAPQAVTTRDPAINALATSQAQQGQILSGMATQIAQPAVVPLQPATPGPTVTSVVVVPATVPEVPKTSSAGLPENLYKTPVQCQKSFNDASAWLICEPGVLLDNTTAWTIPSTKETWYSNVPEGASTYFSLGQGKITVDGYTLNLPYEEGHNYLVLIRGRIDDGKVDTDRNLTAEVTDFVPGHAIWSYMPKGAYVSKDWFLQQLSASTTESYTNCGALGCSHVTVVLFDVDTHFEQRFEIQSDDLTNWTLVQN